MGAAPDLGTSELVRRPWVCVTKKTGEKLSPAASLCQGDTQLGCFQDNGTCAMQVRCEGSCWASL